MSALAAEAQAQRARAEVQHLRRRMIRREALFLYARHLRTLAARGVKVNVAQEVRDRGALDAGRHQLSASKAMSYCVVCGE